MNVLFINCVCSNTGDAAIFEAAQAVMRHAWRDTQFLVQDDHPQRVGNLYPSLGVRGSCYWSLAYAARSGWRGELQRRRQLARFDLALRLMRAGMESAAKRLLAADEADYLEAYQWADVVVATGGTYLVEHYDLGQRLFDMRTAVSLGRPLLLYTQSLGPFKNQANRTKLARILNRARLILLRDERSKENLRDLNIGHEQIRLTPDAAFVLADEDLATRPTAHSPLSQQPPRIAISVRRWDHFVTGSAQERMNRYRESFVALIAHLVRCYNAEVTFLSTCQGAPGYHDDSQTAAAIVEILPKEVRGHVRVDVGFHTPSELMRLLRGFDCVVSTRMHLAILALGVGTPVLPIAYEFKTTELCNSLGYPEAPLHIEEVSSVRLIAAYESFVRGYSAHAKHLNEAVSRFRRQAWEIADVLHLRFPQPVARKSAVRSASQASPAANNLGSPIDLSLH